MNAREREIELSNGKMVLGGSGAGRMNQNA